MRESHDTHQTDAPPQQKAVSLTKQSLIAACAAAYLGGVLFFAIDLVWRIRTGADARICPANARNLTDVCTILEYSVAFLLDFLWGIYALPFALIVSAPPAWALGRLVPWLERRLKPRRLFRVEYILGASTGALVIATIAAIESDLGNAPIEIAVGAVAGLFGAFVFRRVRYPDRQPLA